MGGRGSAGRSSGPRPGPSRYPASGRIRDAVANLLAGTDGYVMISDVRAALSDLPRAEADAALRELFSQPEVSIVPESNQKVLTPEERAGAIRIGNQDKHLISIRTPLDPSARERVQTAGVGAASDADLTMAQRDPRTRSALYDEIRAEVRRRKATP